METIRTALFYGDSNTYGFDPRDFFGGRYQTEVIWTSLLASALEGRWNIVNEGMNGRQLPSTKGDLKYVEFLLQKLTANDLFAVMLGTNDILMTLEPDADRPVVRMDRFLSWLTQHKDPATILVIAPVHVDTCGVNDPLYQRYYDESVRMNACFKELAEIYKVRFADAGGWNIETAHDGAHFTIAGHQSFSEHMVEILNQI